MTASRSVSSMESDRFQESRPMEIDSALSNESIGLAKNNDSEPSAAVNFIPSVQPEDLSFATTPSNANQLSDPSEMFSTDGKTFCV